VDLKRGTTHERKREGKSLFGKTQRLRRTAENKRQKDEWKKGKKQAWGS